ncbi:MAG: SDR family oxidoreductase [Anaerolineae bacterium]|nr:SDR family oxidoreductase [Anaerolineae bacterium]
MAGRRLLVAGGSGTLGGPLSVCATAAGWDVAATYLTRPDRILAGTPVQLDLRDESATRDAIRAFRPTAIIHAAVTERSGTGYDDAIRLSAQHLAHSAVDTGTRLIALSTDLVFDGTETLYTEESPAQPSPNSLYGQAKLDAEHTIRAINPAALIVRTSLIYDFDRENAQVAWMLRAIERGEKLRLYVDQIRCPIWAWNLAGALLELVDSDAAGLLHVVGPEPVSRYDLGVALLEALGIDPAGHVQPADAPGTLPRSLVLSVARARNLLINTPLLTIAQARAQWTT